MMAEDLLAVAQSLVPAGPGRPLHAALRRSVSTAYYALFTALTEEVGRVFTAALRPSARRLLDHGSAGGVLRRIEAEKRVPWVEGRPGCDPDLLVVAKTFSYLRLERHLADYDYAYTPRKSDALKAIARARIAIRSLARARSSCPDQLDMVCLAMIATERTRRRLED